MSLLLLETCRIWVVASHTVLNFFISVHAKKSSFSVNSDLVNLYRSEIVALFSNQKFKISIFLKTRITGLCFSSYKTSKQIAIIFKIRNFVLKT